MTKKRIDPKLPIAPAVDDGIGARITQLFGSAVDGVWAWLMRPDSFGDRLVRRLNELFLERDGSGVEILDEGVDLGHADALNFVGSSITATLSETTGTINVEFTGGGGQDTITATAVEDIAAGQFVAVYNASGTPKCRVAKSSSGQGYQADGFCKDAFAAGATATIYLPGAKNVAGGTGLTAGDVWLGTDGYATNTAPTTAGYISQQIGVAQDATTVAFEPQPDVLISAGGNPTYGGTSQSIQITSTGTLNIPVGVTGGDISMAGGGGGGSARSGGGGGGGGGASEHVMHFPVHVTSGGAYSVTIGAGGVGAVAGSAGAGTDGGDTSITIGGLTLYVRGGKGGASNGNGGAGGGTGGASGGAAGAGVGGNGVLGSLESVCHFGGSSGGAGGAPSSVGGTGGPSGGMNSGAAGGATGSQSGGGGGGATPWGIGGAGGAGTANGSDAAATSYGAGGGGGGGSGSTSTAGGKGCDGILIFSYVA